MFTKFAYYYYNQKKSSYNLITKIIKPLWKKVDGKQWMFNKVDMSDFFNTPFHMYNFLYTGQALYH